MSLTSNLPSDKRRPGTFHTFDDTSGARGLIPIQRSIALNPLSPAAHNNLGSAFQKLGQTAEAIASYRRALQLQPDMAVAHANILMAMNYDPQFTPRWTPTAHRLGSFRLVRQTGAAVADIDLRGRVHVASFIYTKCAAVCPLVVTQLARVQRAIHSLPNALIVSFTVTPDTDTGTYVAPSDAGPAVPIQLLGVWYLDIANTRAIANLWWDHATGTLQVRGLFPNPLLAEGVRLLSPGMFVRVRVPISEPRPGVLVTDRAIGTDQDRKYVLVVNDKNVVEYRPVKLGPLQNALRAVTDGLAPGEWVIVNGIQRARPGGPVTPQKVSMRPGPPAEAPS